MRYMPELFSLLFFSLIFIYLFWGFYIIRLNPKGDVNRVFLAMCISLVVWSFGFSMANDASSIETALFWRRFSAIGWTSFYGFVLHFFLLFTHKDISLHRKKLFRLLHIPGLITMYVFAFSDKMAQIQYDLKYFTSGWVNLGINTAWDWFFYSYYVSYLVITLIVIWKWKQQIDDKKIAKQGNILILSFLFAFIVGTLVDIGTGLFLNEPLPQMAPVFIIFPTWAMYYSARYYGLIERDASYKEEIVVTDDDQTNIFRNLAWAFFAGAFLTLISEYSPLVNEGIGDLKAVFIKSSYLFATGIGIYFSQNIKKKYLKDLITISILLLSIPLITFKFLNDAALTVWAFPMIIIMSSLIFSKRTLLISATIVSILTQRLIWTLKPEISVVINQYDYIGRMGMMVLVFFIAFYINKLYVSKIKENKEQIKFQKLNADISLEFVNINLENSNEKINKLLASINSFFGVDRTYFYLINDENKTMRCSYEFHIEELKPIMGKVKNISLDAFPWWIKELEENKKIYIENVEIMPVEASREQEELILNNIKSLIVVAIEGEEQIQGFLGINANSSFKKWSDENIKQLAILSNLVSNGLVKIKDERKIEFMAYYDSLTLLPNRFLFMDRTNQAINLSKRNRTFISVIFINIDNFKFVNDTIGHQGGDLLLKEIANRLEDLLRSTDTIARFGGDEFLIMINDINDYKDISIIADKIVKLFSEPIKIKGQDFLITASLGISVSPADGENAEILIKNANIAMYKAKEDGKNQYVFCTESIKEEIENNIFLLSYLIRALEKKELVVYYQAQVDLTTGEINGIEALVRWNHPQKGMISPEVFIPLAEKNGLINSIGEWVLREACSQNKKWQEMGFPKVCMAVNLSGIQLLNTNIINIVEDILKETNLSPKYLELEITESIAINKSIFIEETLTRLKKIGIKIAIDDFGTEYSSLSRLKMLPIDRIKIDIQFTQGIENNEKDRAITMVIINLAKSLGLNVIAEGVETKAQRDFLKDKLCDDAQGYLYHKPMPAEEMEKILNKMNKQIELKGDK